MTIKHLDELDIKTFIDCIEHLDEFEVSEKIDGAELIFGFDNDGFFYTSREAKGGKRFYFSSEWPVKFWTTGFRGASLALFKVEEKLKQFLKPGESVEVEILCGNIPNTVPYSNNHNQIVFLRCVEGKVNIKELSKNLEGIAETVIVNGVPTTDDGWTTDYYEYATQEWTFASVPTHKINCKNFKAPKFNENLIELASQRVTPTTKEIVLAARGTLQLQKDDIKDELIKKLVSGTPSGFGQNVKNSWIEGLVFRHPKTGFQFKLVDKATFTKANTEKHSYVKFLRDTYWKPFVKKTYEISEKMCSVDLKVFKPQTQYFDDLDLFVGLTPFEPMQTSLIQECDLALHNLRIERDKHKEIKEKHVNEEFASLCLRLTQIREELTLATCVEHLLEVIMFEEIKLTHLKKFHHNEKPIASHDIPITLDYLANITGMDAEGLQKSLLGSSWQKAFCNDIDVCIDTNKVDIELTKMILDDRKVTFNYTPSLNILHVVFPIKGQSKNGYVQIDLILTKNPDWTRFWFRGTTRHSEYKGLYRNALLRAVAGSSNEIKRDKGDSDIYYRKGWVLSPKNGLQWQVKERYKSFGGKRIKNFKTVESHDPVTDVVQVLHHLFPNQQLKAENVESFEQVWELVKNSKNKKTVKLIAEITIKILKEGKYKIPRELIYDL